MQVLAKFLFLLVNLIFLICKVEVVISSSQGTYLFFTGTCPD